MLVISFTVTKPQAVIRSFNFNMDLDLINGVANRNKTASGNQAFQP